MQLRAVLAHWNAKTKPPDLVLGIERSPENYIFSVGSLLSKHGVGLKKRAYREREA